MRYVFCGSKKLRFFRDRARKKWPLWGSQYTVSDTFRRHTMVVMDPLALAYADLLTGQYDCVDRIILNAIFDSLAAPEDSACGGAVCTAATTRSTPRT